VELSILGLPTELSLMLLGELLVVIAWLLWPLVSPRVKRRRARAELFEVRETRREIPVRERVWIIFYDLSLLALLISSVYTLVLATFAYLIAFQPFDPRILALSILLYAAGGAMIAYAWSKSRKAIEEEYGE